MWFIPAVALLWVSCSIERNYALLSFFFDGVPDPRLIAAGSDAVRVAKETGGVFYTHQPYAQEMCGECHTDPSGGMLTKVDAHVCVKCHAQVLDEHHLMHGPVAASACLWCHAPHESTVKPLLRSTAPTVCRQCHSASLMGNPSAPVHSDLNRDCLECHSGHGGQKRFFLHDAGLIREGSGTLPTEPSPNGE